MIPRTIKCIERQSKLKENYRPMAMNCEFELVMTQLIPPNDKRLTVITF